MKQVKLGKTGLTVSQLCIGTGTSGWNKRSNQTRLGLTGLAELLRYAHDQGLTFIDSADQYGSHPHVAEACKTIGRDKLVITTKTTSRTYDTVKADLERFRRELNTDYLDIVLLHCLMEKDWPKRYPGAMEALEEARQKKLLRAHGVSCHDFGAFCTAAETAWVQVVLARINYAGQHMDEVPERVVPVIKKMHEAGKGIYGMKVMGQGNLGHDPFQAIHWDLDLGCLHAIVIGMESKKEVDENLRCVQQHALVAG